MTTSSAQPELPPSGSGNLRPLPSAVTVRADPTTPTARPVRSATTPLLWALSLMIGYVLSPLPVGVALDLLPPKYALPAHRGLRTVYAPLVWISNRVPQVHAFYDWYEDLFDV